MEQQLINCPVANSTMLVNNLEEEVDKCPSNGGHSLHIWFECVLYRAAGCLLLRGC